MGLATTAVLGAVIALLSSPWTVFAMEDIVIDNPWAWSSTTPEQRAGAIYLTITNRGAKDDHLRGAVSPLARSVTIHETIKEGDVVRTRPLRELAIPRNTTIALRPGGLHLMLTGLGAPLEPGAAIPLTLVFRLAGRVTVGVAVHDRSRDRRSLPPHLQGRVPDQVMERERQGESQRTGPKEPDYAPPGPAGGPREPTLEGRTPNPKD